MARRGRGIKAIAADLREIRVTCHCYGTTFIDGISKANKEKVEKQLKNHFKLWWDSLVSPLIKELEDNNHG